MDKETKEMTERYEAMTRQEKNKYLKKNLIVFCGEEKVDDGVLITVEMDEEFAEKFRNLKKENETDDELFSRILNQLVKEDIDASKKKRASEEDKKEK